MSRRDQDVDRGLLFASLASLKDWREEVAASLAQLRRWALVHRLTDDHTASRMAYLERRLAADRLSIAFVAEASRGKNELVNALFFADLGAHLLPAGPGPATVCPIEIHHDPSRAPSIRLLPIETRESPRALREFIADDHGWEEVFLDPTPQEGLGDAFGMLSQTRTIGDEHAQLLGLPDRAMASVEIARWRYAIVNYPHPLLALGLTILIAPGRAALDAEPELTLHRLQEADAVVFVLCAQTGLAPADLDLWREHVEPLKGQGHTRFVVLGRIDRLWSGSRDEARILDDIDRQARDAADRLGVDPLNVFPLSAQLGHRARDQGDGEALARSRLQPFEEALARGLVDGHRKDHAVAARAEVRTLLAEARALLESRRAFVHEQVDEMGALQGRNQKLVQALGTKAADERLRIQEVRTALSGLRAVHNRHAAELAKLLDPNFAQEAGNRARAAVLAAPFSAGIGEALDGYFGEIRERIAKAVGVIDEVKAMMTTVNLKFAASWGLSPVEMNPFPTDRFFFEIDRLDEHCTRDFRSASSLLSRGRRTLALLFFDTVALKTIHVYQIADREIRTWMDSFIRLLEAQVGAVQEQANTRVEGMARIRDADSNLAERIEDMNAILRDCEERAQERQAHEQLLERLLDPGAKP